jgi:endonuclease-3 related protein
MQPTPSQIMDLYQRLYGRYGPRGWWPATADGGRFEVICGAILTQNTSWRNVEKALLNMRSAGLWSFPSVHAADSAALAEVIRPSGYYNTKARKLKEFAEVVEEEFAGSVDAMFGRPVDELRGLLLGIWGIGEETADDIIVYAAEKPSFVIDTYTVRIVDRLGWQVGGRGLYGDYKRFFEERLPADTPLFNEFHALLDAHAARTCKKQAACKDCCLLEICATGQGDGHRPHRRSGPTV